MPGWVIAGFQEYNKRLPANFNLHLIEIPLIKRSKNADIKQILQEESKQVISKIPTGSFIIALDEKGKQWDTVQLAQNLQNWQENYKQIAILIGGPDGFSEDCKKAANEIWSLSKLTMPHALVRVIVAEQIYRSWSLLQSHPYHRP